MCTMILIVLLTLLVLLLIQTTTGALTTTENIKRMRTLSSFWSNGLQRLPHQRPVMCDSLAEHVEYVQSKQYNIFEPNDTLPPFDSEVTVAYEYFSKDWCEAMIADFAICPFTLDGYHANGGKIKYSISSASTSEVAFSEFWEECAIMLESDIKEISTVLLVLPDAFESIVEFEKFTATLDQGLETGSDKFKDEISLVYFHPEFQFRDKDGQNMAMFNDAGEFIGMSNDMVNPIDYSRRSPWPIINILRTPSVTRLQRNVPEGKVFNDNKTRLEAVGVVALQSMLDDKDWEKLPSNDKSFYMKANRE